MQTNTMRKSACLLGIWIAALSAGRRTVSYRIEIGSSVGRRFSVSAKGGNAVDGHHMRPERELESGD